MFGERSRPDGTGWLRLSELDGDQLLARSADLGSNQLVGSLEDHGVWPKHGLPGWAW